MDQRTEQTLGSGLLGTVTNMRFIAILATLILASCVRPAHSAEARKYMVYGAGAASCGAWLAARRAGDWYLQGQWVLGFVSGYGYSAGNSLKNTDNDAMASWIDNYCQKHPLENLSEAAQGLVAALGARE